MLWWGRGEQEARGVMCVPDTTRVAPKTRMGRDEARTLPRLAACSGQGLGIKESHEGPPSQRHPNCLGNSLCNSCRERNSASF